MIPQRNLSLLSERLAERGGRRIPESVLERDYCLSWFLIGLSRSPLRDRLVFKGGTALKKCYFGDYRFSEDVDFTLTEETAWEEIERGLGDVFEETRRASGVEIRLDRLNRHSHVNSHTFFAAYEGPLPRASGKIVKIDITIRERLVFPIEERPVLRGYDEYRDLPEGVDARWQDEFLQRLVDLDGEGMVEILRDQAGVLRGVPVRSSTFGTEGRFRPGRQAARERRGRAGWNGEGDGGPGDRRQRLMPGRYA